MTPAATRGRVLSALAVTHPRVHARPHTNLPRFLCPQNFVLTSGEKDRGIGTGACSPRSRSRLPTDEPEALGLATRLDQNGPRVSVLIALFGTF